MVPIDQLPATLLRRYWPAAPGPTVRPVPPFPVGTVPRPMVVELPRLAMPPPVSGGAVSTLIDEFASRYGSQKTVTSTSPS